jgi:hypothetical protein
VVVFQLRMGRCAVCGELLPSAAYIMWCLHPCRCFGCETKLPWGCHADGPACALGSSRRRHTASLSGVLWHSPVQTLRWHSAV